MIYFKIGIILSFPNEHVLSVKLCVIQITTKINKLFPLSYVYKFLYNFAPWALRNPNHAKKKNVLRRHQVKSSKQYGKVKSVRITNRFYFHGKVLPKPLLGFRISHMLKLKKFTTRWYSYCAVPFRRLRETTFGIFYDFPLCKQPLADFLLAY